MSSHQSFSRLSLHKITSTRDFPFSPVEFSRFKFGDDGPAQRFGTAMAEAFIREYYLNNKNNKNGGEPIAGQTPSTPPTPEPELVVACSYQAVPTAACALRRHFVRHLNRWTAANGLAPVRKVKIHRSTTYQVDYSTLSAEGRARHIGRDRFHLDRDLVAGRTIVVLDDVRITGGHETRLLRMFRELDVREPLVFLYFAELLEGGGVLEPGIENRLNFYDVRDIFDLEDVVGRGGAGFAINARFVKYVLAYEHDAFCRFLAGRDDDFAGLLLRMAVGNGYHEEHEYAANMAELDRRLCFGQPLGPRVVAKGINLLMPPSADVRVAD